MTFEQRLALARDLIGQRDAIDAQLASLFDGGQTGQKLQRRCRHCGQTGHRSDACPGLACSETAETDGVV